MSKITLFVCTNHRHSGDYPSCGARGGQVLLNQLQTATQECTFKVQESICLGHCVNGKVVKISPGGAFYHKVTELDIPKLVSDANQLAITESSPNTESSTANFDSLDID